VISFRAYTKARIANQRTYDVLVAAVEQASCLLKIKKTAILPVKNQENSYPAC
jgi:hypothetical protein